jgi:hypothetical protein
MPPTLVKTRRGPPPDVPLSHTGAPTDGAGNFFHKLADNDGHSSQTRFRPMWTISLVTPDSLTIIVRDFLSEAAGAVVLEDGAVAFDLGQSKYSISGQYDK